VYCYGVVWYKASHALHPFSYLLCVPHLISNHSCCIYHSFLAVIGRQLVAKQEKFGEKWSLYFTCEVSLFIPVGNLTCCKIFRHGADGFSSPARQVVLCTFIALKNK
jgi:hypothetical protein